MSQDWPVRAYANWRVSHYDFLDVPQPESQTWAPACLGLLSPVLGVSTALPARQNLLRQAGEECGFYVLHYLEEEARRYRGEGLSVKPLSIKYRVERLQAIIGQLGKPTKE